MRPIPEAPDVTYAMLAACIEAAGGKVRIPNLTLLRLQTETMAEIGQDPDGTLTLTLVPRKP
jgi:hypothetical protein